MDAEACPQCGHPAALCADPDVNWFPQRTVCEVTMARMGALNRYNLLHGKKPWHDGTFTSWAEKPSLEHPFKFDDGVNIWMSQYDLTPDDDFLEQSVVSGEQVLGEHGNAQHAEG